MKKGIKIVVALIGIILVSVVMYAIYFLTSATRIEDNTILEISNNNENKIILEEEYTIVTYNVGFGAYSPEFSFFMDGGTESLAKNPEEVKKNINGAIADIESMDADFIMYQEIDIKADRSHDIDIQEMMVNHYTQYASQLAINYDSPYILYPLTQPHGKSEAGMLTLSKYKMDSAIRRSLPISESLDKVLDLDRCYSITEIPVETGENLYLYQTHFTAYGGGPEIAKAQIEMMFEDMSEKLNQGDYVICGGDFNHDLLGNAVELLNENIPSDFSWSSPMPYELIDERFSYVNSGTVPTVRDCAEPYIKGETLVSIIDGFFVSPNISVTYAETIDVEFEHSDHQPVAMKFTLNQ